MPVTSFAISSREPYADGQSFGDTGPYERIEGRLTYAVDPGHAMNAGIVDLALAPRDAEGRVTFAGDVSLFLPADAARGNGVLLLDVPNRGRRLWPSQFNRASAQALLENPCPPGDGFLFRCGYAVADVAWQWDVLPVAGLTFDAPEALEDGRPIRGPVMSEFRPSAPSHTFPLGHMGHKGYPAADVDEPGARLLVKDYDAGPATEVPRDRWRFARETDAGIEPSPRHVYVQDALEPGRIYSVVYTTEGAPVVGSGLLALRDAAIFLRGGGAGPSFSHVHAFGASQSGRILRHLLSLGLNRGEDDAIAFDGVHVHIAGAQRGEFNQRFGQPSVLATPGFGHRPPFADDGLLATLRERDAVPHVVATNTSWEYWRGDAGLLHTAPDGSRDLDPAPTTRVYHFAGTQHVPGGLPQPTEFPLTGDRTRYGFGVVEHTPLTRAAFVALDRWVREGIEPPPSCHPRLADGTAVTRAEALAGFPALPGLVTPDIERLPAIRAIDLGPEADAGIGSYPPVLGGAHACLVSAVDADGNEIAGIRLPDVAAPAGTHTGWNLRHPDTGAGEQTAHFVGFTSFFAPTEAARAAKGDPRPPLEARYADREAYVAAARAVADGLAAESYLLAEDTDIVTTNAARRFDAAGGG